MLPGGLAREADGARRVGWRGLGVVVRLLLGLFIGKPGGLAREEEDAKRGRVGALVLLRLLGVKPGGLASEEGARRGRGRSMGAGGGGGGVIVAA